MPIIGGAKCIVTHPTKILGGHGPPAAYPTAPHMGSGELCKLPERGPQSHFAALYARKTHLVAAFLVLWSALQWVETWKPIRSNLVSAGNLRHINIIVVQTGKLIFVASKFAAP